MPRPHPLAALALALFLACASSSPAQAPATPTPKPRLPAEGKQLVPPELVPPSPALSAEEELKTFQLAPGIRVELVASEPLVAHPVAVQFDPDGRMWVVEMAGYMPNLEGTGEDKPVGRVSILTDTDGDGRMDKRQVFLDGLVMPRAILLVGDGALIGAPPNLWYCPDKNRDGRADEKIDVAQDFGRAIDPNNVAIGEPENKPNNPLWGYDNWIHVGHYTAKFRWRGGQFERGVDTSLGQWGLSQDDWGHLFNNSNSSQLHAQMIPSHYLARNPNYPRPGGRNVTVAKDQSVWPVRVSPGINRGYLPEMLREYKLKNFTSACAPWIYRGDLFPADFYGNAFVCEPAGNLIKRNFVTSENGTLGAREAYEKREFIASTDERFRPVNLTTGPEGALYVCDMYHGIIQHRVSVSRYLEEQVQARGLDKPTGTGRIWRVVPEGSAKSHEPRAKREGARMSQETPAQWVAHLSHPNAWWRETAQRLLVERGDASVVPALEELALTGKTPMARVHALWTLEGLQKLTAKVVTKAFGDGDPRARAAAVRAGESLLGNADDRKVVLEKWFDLAFHGKETSAEVQLQLALSLGEARNRESDLAMAAMCNRAPETPYLRDAVLTGAGGRELELLEALETLLQNPMSQKIDLNLVSRLAGCVLAERNPARIGRLIELTQAIPSTARDRQRAILSGLSTTPIVTPRRPVLLTAEPVMLTKLRESKDRGLAAAVDNVLPLLTWPGKPLAADYVPVEPLTPAQQARFETGKTFYTAVCGACHQGHGLGVEGATPPLADSEWVTGSVERLARIALHGVRGPIQVGKVRYGFDMPGWGALGDENLAAILTYIRREWGHTAAPVETETVAKIRAAAGERLDAWTQPELLKFP